MSDRSERRLFGFAGMVRLPDHVAPPRRPAPGWGRERPRLLPAASEPVALPELPPVAKQTTALRLTFGHSDLDAVMVAVGQRIRDTRRNRSRGCD